MRQPTLTELLAPIERGDTQAVAAAFAIVYEELRSLAHGQRRRWGANATLDTTELVHEAYLKLASADGLAAEGRSHFLGIAARAMRQLLSNHARDRRRLKRGGALRRTTADVDDLAVDISAEDLDSLIAIDDALDRLQAENERRRRVVECRFFAGLSIPDTASALGISAATVKREWALAREWLYRELRGDEQELPHEVRESSTTRSGASKES